MIKTILGKDLPADRSVIFTTTAELWYKIVERTLYAPTLQVLRSNAIEIEKFTESLYNFSILDFTVVIKEFDWTGLKTLEATDLLNFLAVYGGPTIDVACDIETRRVEYVDNKLLLIGFALTLDSQEYVSVVSDFDFKLLQRVFDNTQINFIWHEGKFDSTRLKYLTGLDARIDNDTLLMHYTGINEKKGTHKLKELGQLYLQAPKWDDELQSFKKQWCSQNSVKLGQFTYDMIPLETLIPYLQKDVLATLRLYHLFLKLRREDSVWIYEKLIHASNVYRDIELNGVQLNLEYLKTLKKDLLRDIDTAKEEMQEVVELVWDCDLYSKATGAHIPKKGLEFNMGSSKQLKWLLETLLDKKIESTDKDALEELSNHVEEIDNELGRKFLKAVRAMRTAKKYYDTYALGLEGLACDDGRVRCSYNLHGTETGRLSSSDPNMQNIPRNALIKDLITCRPGYRLLQLDYKQAELCVLTALSGDPYLLSIYENNQDLHNMMATKIHGTGYTKEQRVIIKSINFGIAYGRGPGSIAKMFKLSMQEAVELIADWYDAVPEVKKFIERKRREPFTGVTCKTIFGRERHFVITSENKYHVANEAINFPVSSIASDLTLFSVLELDTFIKEQKLDVKIVATVHDSILMELPDNAYITKLITNTCREIMSNQPKKYKIGIVDVPFRADAEWGYTWGDLDKMEV